MQHLRGKRVLVTGARGTIGRPLTRALIEAGASVVAWDRRRTSPLDVEGGRHFVREAKPDVVYHLAVASEATNAVDEARRINRDWPVWIAETCEAIGAKLVFTSTAMVFSNAAQGPFRIDTPPDSPDGYGYEKRRAEQEVLARAPGAVIVRLGWQIDDALGTNNMVDNLARQVAEHGKIRASTRWLPACSFLSDTVKILLELPARDGGLYMLDANEGWTFHAIATALADRRGEGWRVEATTNMVQDQRLLDPRLSIPSLRMHLPALADIPPAPVP